MAHIISGFNPFRKIHLVNVFQEFYNQKQILHDLENMEELQHKLEKIHHHPKNLKIENLNEIQELLKHEIIPKLPGIYKIFSEMYVFFITTNKEVLSLIKKVTLELKDIRELTKDFLKNHPNLNKEETSKIIMKNEFVHMRDLLNKQIKSFDDLIQRMNSMRKIVKGETSLYQLFTSGVKVPAFASFRMRRQTKQIRRLEGKEENHQEDILKHMRSLKKDLKNNKTALFSKEMFDVKKDINKFIHDASSYFSSLDTGLEIITNELLKMISFTSNIILLSEKMKQDYELRNKDYQLIEKLKSLSQSTSDIIYKARKEVFDAERALDEDRKNLSA